MAKKDANRPKRQATVETKEEEIPKGIGQYFKIGGAIVNEVWEVYRRESTPKHQVLDILVLTCLLSAATNVLYYLCGGTFPLNGFFAALLANLAVACGALGLRLQISCPDKFPGITPEKGLLDFIVVVVVVGLAGYSFLG